MVHVTSTIVSIATLTRVERVMVIVTQELALQERPVELIIFLNIIHFCGLCSIRCRSLCFFRWRRTEYHYT